MVRVVWARILAPMNKWERWWLRDYYNPPREQDADESRRRGRGQQAAPRCRSRGRRRGRLPSTFVPKWYMAGLSWCGASDRLFLGLLVGLLDGFHLSFSNFLFFSIFCFYFLIEFKSVLEYLECVKLLDLYQNYYLNCCGILRNL
jgi:hypothetical protein